ncbi:phospholipase D-like domain-containing protein [Geobacter argillaceus]|uniref:Phospholipase D-like protein n=1 Tax=Geobacter argillaceus TaxID=345631 RepID=A0A562V8R3_9BACT|nr:phospholipase D-like domain-containing protein [Geobacter argillaceus]TWJ14294.1 phospholipase D-like protein [Geobacter argillaceus]
MNRRLIPFVLSVALLSGCATMQRATPSAGPLAATARVITDNDAAFLNKLKLVEGATSSIDLMYYIFADDYSSSTLSKALIDAAKRGVTVRLLVDYHTNYGRLDLFSLLEREGGGNLQVRLYNRPTKNIVQDAVYMTMGCSPAAFAPGTETCSAGKFAAIDRLFADETIDGQPVGSRNISNLNIGNSGLFLSGLYAKRPDLMAQAVQQGQNLDLAKMKGGAPSATPQDKENLKKVAQSYWDSRTAPLFERLEAKAFLFFAFALYGEQLNPIDDLVTGILPVGKEFSKDETRDWNHLTDFLHHKLLLVDGHHVQMGGRNIEDSYHMHPNPLVKKYLFMDTDLYAELRQGGDEMVRSFDDLWNFSAMVATLAEVRQHAPNDFAANGAAFREAEKNCKALTEAVAREACIDNEFQARFLSLDQRLARLQQEMTGNEGHYREHYLPTVAAEEGGFPVDAATVLTYFENIPFNRSVPPAERARSYGAIAGKEGASEKNITALWLQSLPEVCVRATPANPARIILHNAYFFPAANLTFGLSQLAGGALDCSNVTVTVLTNSIETTDLNVVNLAARHSLKAFTEFYQQQKDQPGRARFEYFEYQPQPGKDKLSLHSKVTVLGDDIVIGSANADVRSFMMDSNNVMLVRNAPAFAAEYRAFVQHILDEPGRVTQLNDYFANTPRETMLEEDLAVFRQILAKYGVDKKLDEAQLKQVEGRFVEMLNAAYELTKGSLDPAASLNEKRKQQDTFNEKFKPI